MIHQDSRSRRLCGAERPGCQNRRGRVSALVESRGTPYAVRTPAIHGPGRHHRRALRDVVVRGPPHAGGARGRRGRQRRRGPGPYSCRSGPLRPARRRGRLPDGSGVALLTELAQPGLAARHRPGRRRRPVLRARRAAAGVRGFVVTDAPAGDARVPTHRRRAAAASRACPPARSRSCSSSPAALQPGHRRQLHLSALTVKSHLARIARKLGTGDRAEMVALALRAGVIELSPPLTARYRTPAVPR